MPDSFPAGLRRRAAAVVALPIVVLMLATVSGCERPVQPQPTTTSQGISTAPDVPPPVVSSSGPSPVPTSTMLEPSSNAQPPQPIQVAYPQLIRGRATGLAPGQSLWLFVKPLGDSRYYPQEGPLNFDMSGNWSQLCYLGPPGALATPQTYDLLTAVATPAASKAIAKFREAAKETERKGGKPQWGMYPLPAGVTTISTVLLIRRAN
jgi:hypothetical protein